MNIRDILKEVNKILDSAKTIEELTAITSKGLQFENEAGEVVGGISYSSYPDLNATDTYESLVKQAMMDANNIQKFLWAEESWSNKPFDAEEWSVLFQKRVDKIKAIDTSAPQLESRGQKAVTTTGISFIESNYGLTGEQHMKTFLIIMLVVMLQACGGTNWKNESDGYVKTSIATSQKTSEQATVYSKDGISQEQLALAQQGLTDAFNDARLSGYSRTLNSSGYTISIPVIPCVPSPVFGTMSFQLRADSYDGTEFDQYNPRGAGVKDGIGVILAAEMVTDLSGSMIVCSDASVIKDAVRNGAEHIIIWNNDNEYYSETWFHGGGGMSHPLLPKHLDKEPKNFTGQGVSVRLNGSVVTITK